MSAGADEDDTVAAPPEAPGAPADLAPTDSPASPVPPVRAWSRRKRLLVLAAAGVAAVASVLPFVVGRRPSHAPAAIVRTDGGVAIHAVEPPHVAVDLAGTVRLTGTVVDGAGAPVAGAEVSAELEHGAGDRALVGSAVAVDAGVAPAITLDAGTASALVVAPPTGPEGRFALAGLTPGRYRVHVSGAGLLAAEVRYVPVPSDETRIVVVRQVSIDGVVTDSGKPVANATIGIRSDAVGGTIEARSDLTGAFHVGNLPEGRYQVWAWQAALASRTIRVAHLGAGPFPPLELPLEAGAIVVGRVLDHDEGTGIIAAIELRPASDDQAPRYARSGDDGVFRIEGVQNGRWIADAFAPGYATAGGVELDAGHGIPELVLVRGGAIEGRVLDGDGQPIAGASVRALGAATGSDASAAPVEISEQVELDRLRRFSGRTATPTALGIALGGDFGNGDPRFVARGELGVLTGPIPPIPPPGTPPGRQAVVEVGIGAPAGIVVQPATMLGDPPPLAADPVHGSIWVTGADGRYRIRGVARGKVSVIASAPGYAEARSKLVTLVAGELQTNVDLVVTPGSFVVGTVTDQHGVPIVGAELHVQPEVGAPVDSVSAADGTYRIGPVTGTVALHVGAYGHSDVTRTLELAPVRGREPGEHREDVVLVVADAVLAGTLDDVLGVPVAGARVLIVGGPSDGRAAVVAADGTFSIDMLPAGKLRVHVDHPDYPPDDFDVDTAVHARLRLALGGAVEGALIDAVSAAPLAGVTIAAVGPAGALTEGTTEKSGRWKLGPLRPGTWKLTVAMPGYLTITREVDVPASSAPGRISVHDVRIDLPRGALVGGTVRDARGQRAAGAHVLVRRADGAGVTVEADADANGEFRIRDCPAGDLEVLGSRGDERGMVTATVRGGDEVLSLSLELR